MKKIFYFKIFIYLFIYCIIIAEEFKNVHLQTPKFPTGKEKRDEHREERNVSDVKILYLIHPLSIKILLAFVI